MPADGWEVMLKAVLDGRSDREGAQSSASIVAVGSDPQFTPASAHAIRQTGRHDSGAMKEAKAKAIARKVCPSGGSLPQDDEMHHILLCEERLFDLDQPKPRRH